MAVDKLVDSTQLNADLTLVANAIRTKGGTSAQLAFPSGFVSAIDAIPTGGGGTDYLAALLENELTSYEVTSDRIKAHTFRGASALTSVTFAAANLEIEDYAFYQSGLTYAVLPSLAAMGSFAFGAITSLQAVDIATTTMSEIYTNIFNGSANMNMVVIRDASVLGLRNINAFTNTPFASGKSGGTLYVPNSLISSYQSATNWGTILGYANNQIKSIESTHTDPNAPIDLTTHYVDGTLISA
ncbi:MAG: leucine-rich repeat protein [Ruminococcus sp.]|nr:leucine-rich repeat protein [Ruminococcus sp.]MBQ2487521.1 leucine-rich repeat protein [Ruminococcus sp.]